MAATTVLSGFPEGLKDQGYDYYWETYDPLPKVFSEVFEVKKSNKLYEKSTSAVGTGLLVEKAENAPGAIKSPIEGYTVQGKNTSWMKVESVSKELRDDHQKFANFLKSQMPQWSKDVVETQETHYANIFNYGGYTAGHAMFDASAPGADDTTANYQYDSKPLFYTSNATYNHVSKGGTQYYNGLALTPSKANMQAAWNLFTITNAKKEDDTKMAISPTMILANPALKWTVDELIKSPDDPTTSNRAINVMRDLVKPLYWHYLSSTTQWSLLKPKFGMVALMRENPEFDMWEDKLTKDYYMSIFVRFGHMINNWRGIVSSNFSTS